MALSSQKTFSLHSQEITVQSQQSATFVLSGPSGSGKGSTMKHVRILNPNVCVPVSHTTRLQRNGEVDGEHYHFVSAVTFGDMCNRGMFVEWAPVHEHFYGTSIESLEVARASSGIVVLEIDVQGALYIKEKYPDVQTVFLLPPSRDELEQRLRGRRTDSDEIVRKRLLNAPGEILEAQKFDWWFVNRHVEQSASDFLNLIGFLMAKEDVFDEGFRSQAVYNSVLRTFFS